MFDPTNLADGWTALMLTAGIKGLVLLAIALVFAQALRRSAAASRHLVWTLAVVGMLSLPLLGAAVPDWAIPGVGLPTPASTRTTETTATNDASHGWTTAVLEPIEAANELPVLETDRQARLVSPPAGARVVRQAEPANASASPVPTEASWLAPLVEVPPSVWAVWIWELGLLLVVGRLVMGWVQVRRLEQRSVPVTDGSWISVAEVAADEVGLRRVPRLLRTDDAVTPLVWGVFRARVLVPASAHEWDFEKRLDVLRHEFAHVQRRDVATQLLAQIACAVFWFHPLPWVAASRMRLERERACDDRVLLAGSRASSYASHLLDMARTLRSEHGMAAATIGMARRSQLGERMDSLLDHAPRRRSVSTLGKIGLSLAVMAVLLPLSGLRPDVLEAAPPEPEDQAARGFRTWSPSALPAPAPPTPLRAIDLSGERFPRVVRAPRAVGIDPPPSPATRLRAHGLVDGSDMVAGTIVATEDGVRLVSGTMWRGANDWTELEDREIEVDHSEWQMRDDRLEIEVQMNGRLRFAEDESDVELLDEDAYFDFRWEERGDRRRLELELDRDGALERTYYEGSRRADYDDEARAWFASVLPQFLQRAGIAVNPRVDGWIEEGGVDLALERIEDMESDLGASRHLSALLRRDDLDDDELERVVEAIDDDIDSDHEKSRLVIENLDFLFADPERADGAVAILESLDSDFERGRAAQMALQLDGLDDATVDRILVLADGMHSDFEKARVLSTVPLAGMRAGASNGAFFRVLQGMDSDFEKTRVLIEALPLALDDPEARAEMWRTIEDIESDFERVRIIGALAPRLQDDDAMVLEAFEAIEGIKSDFERARVMREFLDAAARSDRVAEEFERLADRITSDHEYGRLMRDLRAARR